MVQELSENRNESYIYFWVEYFGHCYSSKLKYGLTEIVEKNSFNIGSASFHPIRVCHKQHTAGLTNWKTSVETRTS